MQIDAQMFLELVYAVIFMTFFCVSPKVQKRIGSPETRSEYSIWRAINDNFHTSSSQRPILSSLLDDSSRYSIVTTLSSRAINEARNNIDHSLLKDVTNELSALMTKCEKLVLLQQKKFSRTLTIITKISMYIFFIVGGVRQIWTGWPENHGYSNLFISMNLRLVIFVCFLLIVRYAEQIICPYNSKHDVFDLYKILNDKLEEMEKSKTTLTVDTPIESNKRISEDDNKIIHSEEAGR